MFDYNQMVIGNGYKVHGAVGMDGAPPENIYYFNQSELEEFIKKIGVHTISLIVKTELEQQNNFGGSSPPGASYAVAIREDFGIT